MNKKLIVTEADYQQFIDLIMRMSPHVDAALRDKMFDFSLRLEDAKVIKPENIPADVVTVGSRMELEDKSSGEIVEYAVVWPHEADPERGCISVLSPVGMILYGSKIGQEVQCEIPGGIRKLHIRKMLFQPERAPA